eukprot:426004-Amphidinium_carterae.1
MRNSGRRSNAKLDNKRRLLLSLHIVQEHAAAICEALFKAKESQTQTDFLLATSILTTLPNNTLTKSHSTQICKPTPTSDPLVCCAISCCGPLDGWLWPRSSAGKEECTDDAHRTLGYGHSIMSHDMWLNAIAKYNASKKAHLTQQGAKSAT